MDDKKKQDDFKGTIADAKQLAAPADQNKGTVGKITPADLPQSKSEREAAPPVSKSQTPGKPAAPPYAGTVADVSAALNRSADEESDLANEAAVRAQDDEGDASDSVFDEPSRGDADNFQGTLVMTRGLPGHAPEEEANDRTLADLRGTDSPPAAEPPARPINPSSMTIDLNAYGTVDTLDGLRKSQLDLAGGAASGNPPADRSPSATMSRDDDESPGANPGGATMVFGKTNPILKPRASHAGNEDQNSVTIGGAPQAGPRAGGGDHIQQTIAVMWDEAIKSDDGPPTRTIKGTSRPNITDTQLNIQTRNVVNRKTRFDGSELGAEYELLKELGKGGVGVVWLARQASIDRNVAIKMLRPDRVTEPGNREKFLAEAVVTGDLDHPNIVPIYDLGADNRGTLFYSMKRVQGTPWNDVVKEKTLAENLEILLKVADAVGFAHSRGIIHRDLKPENVMLGEYGEVLVMDWGIALPLPEYSKSGDIMRAQQGLGGSPAYMAPEMVLGPIEILAPPTDVYLLGAILFEILVGKPPHTGKNIYQCLNAAARNEIIATDKTGELMDIAQRAMATEMEDRFQTVRDFQNAIRDFQSHEKSIVLAERAREDLQRATETQSYEDYARSVFAYQEAVALWDGNHEAAEGVVEAKFAYAQGALKKGDFDLGLTLVDPALAAHQPVYSELTRARDERNSRQARLARFKQIIAALLVLVSVGGVVGAVAINTQRKAALDAAKKEELAKQDALEEKAKAVAAEKIAVAAAKEEQLAKQAALNEKEKAEKAEQVAVAAAKKEEAAKKEALEEKMKAETAEKIAVAAAKKEAAAKQEALAEKIKAENAEKEALAAARKEEVAKKDALAEKAKAEAARKLAQAAREKADQARADEEKEKRKAEEQSYWAQVGLINSKIRANQFADASDLLAAQENSALRRLRHWEWARQNYLSGIKTTELSPLAKCVMNLPSGIQSLVVAPSEQWLAYSGDKDRVTVVDVGSGEVFITLEYPAKGKITALAVSADERYLAAGGENLDGEVLIWETNRQADIPWKSLAPIKHPGSSSRYAPQKRAVGGIVFIPGPQLSLITFVSNRSELYHWTADVANVSAAAAAASKSPWLEKLRQLRGYFDQVQSARLVPNGLKPGKDALISTHDDGSIRLWDLETDTEALRFVGHSKGAVLDATTSPDGKWLASAGYDKRVLLWNLDAAKRAKKSDENATIVKFKSNSSDGAFCELVGHLESVRRVMFMPAAKRVAEESDERQSAADDSLLLVSTSDDNTAIVWYAGRAIKQAQENAKQLAAGGAQPVAPQPVATNQLVRNVLRGSGSPLQQAFVGQDGLTVIAGTTGLGWRGWNIKTYEEVRQFGDLDKFVVVAAKVLPDGKRLVTALQNGDTMLWDIESGRRLALFEEGHSFLTNTAQFLPNGLEAITSAGDGTTCCWDLVRGVQKYRLQGTGSKGIMALSADGTRLLTGSDRKTALLWDATRGTLLREIEPYAELIKRFRERNPGVTESSFRSQLPDLTALAIAPDNNLILTGDTEGFVKLWSGTGEFINTLTGGHSEAISFVDFLPQVDWVKERHWLAISAGSDGRVTVWNEKGNRDQAASLVTGSTIVAAALSRDARRLVWASSDQFEVASTTATPSGAVAGKAKSESKRSETDATTTSLASKVIVRDLQTSQNAVWANDLPAIVNQVKFFDENDQAVMVTTSEQSKNGVSKRQVLTCYRDGKPLKGGVLREAGPWAAASSPNARQLLAVSGKEARLYDILQQNAETTGFKFNTSLRRHSQVNAVDVSPDGKLLVTAGSEGQVKLWDIETHRALHQFKDGHSPETEVFSVNFSPDGKFLLTAGADGKLCLWNVAERKLVNLAGAPAPAASKTESNSSPIRFTLFSPDGRLLVVSSDQGNARVYDVRWQANSAELLKPREIKFVDEDNDANSRNTVGLSAAVFTPDARHLLTVNNPTIDRGGTARAWSLAATGAFLPRGDKLADNITALALSADGLRALLGDESGRVSLRDMRALSLPAEEDEKFNEVLELARYELAVKKTGSNSDSRHQRRVSFVSFSPNGRDVITASQDGTALLWLGQVLPPTIELSPEETQMTKENQSDKIDPKLRVSYPTKNLLEETQIVVRVEPDQDAVRTQARDLNANVGGGNGDAAPADAKKSEITIDYTPEKSRTLDEQPPHWQINEQGKVLLNSAATAGQPQIVGSIKRENLGVQGESFIITLHKDAPSYLMQEILRSLKVKWDAADPTDSKAYRALIDIVPSSLANQRTIRNPATLERRRINYKVERN